MILLKKGILNCKRNTIFFLLIRFSEEELVLEWLKVDRLHNLIVMRKYLKASGNVNKYLEKIYQSLMNALCTGC